MTEPPRDPEPDAATLTARARVALRASDAETALECAERARAARALARSLPERGATHASRDPSRDAPRGAPWRGERALLEALFGAARRLLAERDPERLVAGILDAAIEAA